MTTKTVVPPLFPSPIPEDRFAQNGVVPSSSILRRVAWAYNHAATNQRKQVFAMSNFTQATYAPVASTEATMTFPFRTGEGVDAIEVILGLAPASTSSASQAASQLKIDDGTSLYFSAEMVYPKVDTGGTYLPSDVEWHIGRITAADGLLPNTIYAGSILQKQYSKIHSCTVYEVAKSVGFANVTGICDPLNWEVHKPIYDAGVQDLAETGTKLWQHNAKQLISWSRPNTTTSAPSFTNTTYGNLFNSGTTAWSSTSPGFFLNTQYHDTVSGDVPVQLAVIATRTSGAGTLDVKLVQTGGDILEQTGISAASSPCATSSHTILAHASTKTDIMVKVSSGTWRIDAIGLWEYEA